MEAHSLGPLQYIPHSKAEEKNIWVSTNPTDPIFGQSETFFFVFCLFLLEKINKIK